MTTKPMPGAMRAADEVWHRSRENLEGATKRYYIDHVLAPIIEEKTGLRELVELLEHWQKSTGPGDVCGCRMNKLYGVPTPCIHCRTREALAKHTSGQ